MCCESWESAAGRDVRLAAGAVQVVRAAYEVCMQEPCKCAVDKADAGTGAAAAAQLPSMRQGPPCGAAAAGCAGTPGPGCKQQGSRGGATSAGHNTAGSPITALLASGAACGIASGGIPMAMAAPAGAQAAGRPQFAGTAAMKLQPCPGVTGSAAAPRAGQQRELGLIRAQDPGSVAAVQAASMVQGPAPHAVAGHHAAVAERGGYSQAAPGVQPAPAQSSVPVGVQPPQLRCRPPLPVSTLPLQRCMQWPRAATDMRSGAQPGAASNIAAAQAQGLKEALPAVDEAHCAGKPGESGAAPPQQGASPVLEHRVGAPATADLPGGSKPAAASSSLAPVRSQQAPPPQPALERKAKELPAATPQAALGPDAAHGSSLSPVRLKQGPAALPAQGRKENLPAAANAQSFATSSQASGQPQRAPPAEARLVPQRRPAAAGAPADARQGAAKRARAGTLLTPFSDSDSGGSGEWA